MQNVGFSNNVPVYGSYPGWINNEGTTGIQVDIIYDLLCEDSRNANNNIIGPLLTTPWNGSTVGESVTFGYSVFPLPYHLHAFSVNQLVPYFIDECEVNSANCYLLDAYRDFCYSGRVIEDVLGATNVSELDFQSQWAWTVANHFSLDEPTIAGLYTNGDPYGSNWDTRVLWKHATSSGVSGTPSAFVNGVKLDSFPWSTQEWIDLLNDVLASQYHA